MIIVKDLLVLIHILILLNGCNAIRRYNLPVLSGSAYIGQLYDAKMDQLLHDEFLWETIVTREKNVTNVVYGIDLEHSQMDRLNNMEMDPNLKLSFMSGLLTVSNIFTHKNLQN